MAQIIIEIGDQPESIRKRAEDALKNIIYNLKLETVEVFATASETQKGRSLIEQGKKYINGKI